MKNLIATLLLVGLVSATAWSQSKTVDQFRSKYQDDRDAKVVSIKGNLFKLIGNIASMDEDDEDAQTIARIADGINSLEILAIPMRKTGFGTQQIEDMRSNLKKEKYDEMMTVKEGSDRVYFMTQGNNSQVKNMLILVAEEDEFLVMNIDGALDMKDLAYLAKNRKKWDD